MPFRPDIDWRPSPHHSSRNGFDIEGTVIHYTAGGRASGSIDWAQDPKSKVSWQFIVDRKSKDGTKDPASYITQQVELDRASWHAGVAEMKYRGEMKQDPKRWTIGVELANHGYLTKNGDLFFYELGGEMRPYRGSLEPVASGLVYDNGYRIDGWWEPYPDEQIDALIWLLRELKNSGYKVDPMVGHEEIAMPFGRKQDPGPLFPWHRIGRTTGRRTKPEFIS